MYRAVFHGLSHGLAGTGFFFVRNPGPQHLRPDVRQEMKRLQLVKETTPEIPRITALCYHEVRPDRKEDLLNVLPEVFRRHIQEFKKAGYKFIDVAGLSGRQG